MPNLLPAQKRRAVRQMRDIHFFTAVLSVIGIVAFVGIVFLLPSLVAAFMTRAALSHALEAEQSATSSEQFFVMEAVADVREEMVRAKINSTLTAPSDVFSRIVAMVPEGIELTQLSLNTEADRRSVRVSGTAADGDTLTSFVETLEVSDLVSEAMTPGSADEGSDIDFTVTLFLREY